MSEETVFIAISELKINTAMHLLKESGIQAHVINKMDSAHAHLFGEFHVIVAKQDEQIAQEILKKAEIL